MAKIAIIINGDTERRHFDNVERSLKVLKGQGYETYVASPNAPTSPHDFYFSASHDEVQKLISQLRQKMGVNDELVIYTTGQGTSKGLCVAGSCETTDLFVHLDKLPYARRVVVMDQSYGGNWGKLFLDDPKTLFISPGSEQETVCCHEFAPKFWDDTIPDLNKDAVISWQERYAHAVSGRKLPSFPKFVPSPGFVDDGKAPFSKDVIPVGSKNDLDKELKKLKPGQYAIVLFSAPTSWCTPCKAYEPKFKTMAKVSDGQHLWLMTEDTFFVAKEYGIYGFPNGFPKVMIINANGDRQLVGYLDRDQVLEELSQSHLPLEERLIKKIAVAERVVNASDRAKAFMFIAYSQVNAGLRDKALPVFEKMISAAEKIVNAKDQANAFEDMASFLAKAGLRDKALPVFEKMVSAAEKIVNAKDQANAFGVIAYYLVKAGLKDKALPVFEKSISAAEKIKNASDRARAFRNIAYSLVDAGFKERAQQLRERLNK